MKSFLAIGTALMAAASASPVERAVVAQEFDVSSFSAGCIPHGTLCTFNFDVATNQMPYQTKCSASFNVAFNLPEVPFKACEDPSIIWSFRRIGVEGQSTPYYALILANEQQSIAAAQIWPASAFPVINDGSSVHQQFTGESRFVVHKQ